MTAHLRAVAIATWNQAIAERDAEQARYAATLPARMTAIADGLTCGLLGNSSGLRFVIIDPAQRAADDFAASMDRLTTEAAPSPESIDRLKAAILSMAEPDPGCGETS